MAKRWMPNVGFRCVGVSFVLTFAGACGRGSPAAEQTAGGPAEPTVFADRLLLASARVALPPSGVAPGDLPDPDSPGAQDIRRYCAQCHELPSPLAHSATDWPSVIRRMWLRMDRVDESFGIEVPTTAERLVMARYLVDNALRVSGAALPEGPGRELFSTTCSQCHDLPDPRQHSPEDWVSVVRRMVGHMESILGASLTSEELQRIVLYLQGVSSSAD